MLISGRGGVARSWGSLGRHVFARVDYEVVLLSCWSVESQEEGGRAQSWCLMYVVATGRGPNLRNHHFMKHIGV